MTTDLNHYLSYYTTARSPGYAVLVTGSWGVGKTYQVKQCLSDTKYLYVSLFGLQSGDAIRLSVMSKLAAAGINPNQKTIIKTLPALGNVITNLESLKPLGRLAQGVAESLVSDTLREHYIIVFDDLERSCMKTKDLLGVLNHYIEDLGNRVVIISNEQELKPAFAKFKEKLIGHTIRVIPQVAEAYDAFVSELDTSESHSFLASQKELILRVFADSACCSLRVLRHVLHDLSRLRKSLSDEHLANASAMFHLVSVFCAYDIEIRSGHIDENDLREKFENPYAFMFEEHAENGTQNSVSRIVKLESKFPLVNFQSDIFSGDVMVDMLIRGRFVHDQILESINASVHFQNPDELPTWKVIMQFESLDNHTVEQAIQRMKMQLQNHEVTHIGEMLHVFSLMMLLSENNVIQEECMDILSFSKLYVDYLVEKKTLSTVDERTLRTEGINHAYDGYTYHVPEAMTQQFNELREYIVAANRTVYQRQLPDAAEDLLKLMRENPQQFLENICHTNSDDQNRFASVPVLMHVDAARFVDSWMHCPVGNWRTISTALDIRYEYMLKHGSLSDEREWATSVYRILQSKAQCTEGLTAWRLRRAIPKALEVLAGDADISELRS